jgi:hypothetical protein
MPEIDIMRMGKIAITAGKRISVEDRAKGIAANRV